jgi:hypothetical protein
LVEFGIEAGAAGIGNPQWPLLGFGSEMWIMGIGNPQWPLSEFGIKTETAGTGALEFVLPDAPIEIGGVATANSVGTGIATFPELGSGSGVGIGGTMISTQEEVNAILKSGIGGISLRIGTEDLLFGIATILSEAEEEDAPVEFGGIAAVDSSVRFGSEAGTTGIGSPQWPLVDHGTIFEVSSVGIVNVAPATLESAISAIGIGAHSTSVGITTPPVLIIGVGVPAWPQTNLGVSAGIVGVAQIDTTSEGGDEGPIMIGGSGGVSSGVEISSEAGTTGIGSPQWPLVEFGIEAGAAGIGNPQWPLLGFGSESGAEGIGTTVVIVPEPDPEIEGIGSLELQTDLPFEDLLVSGDGGIVVTSSGYINASPEIPMHLYARWSRKISISATEDTASGTALLIRVSNTSGENYTEDNDGDPIWHIYTNGAARPDLGDIRFADAYGSKIDYYQDSGTGDFYLDISGVDTTKVSIYYGNPTAESESLEDSIIPETVKTIAFEDDFETEKSGYTSINFSRSGSHAHSGSYGIGCPSNSGRGNLYRDFYSTPDTRIALWIKGEVDTSGDYSLSFVTLSGAVFINIPRDGLWHYYDKKTLFSSSATQTLKIESWDIGISVDELEIYTSFSVGSYSNSEMLETEDDVNPAYLGDIPLPIQIWKKVSHIDAEGTFDIVGIADSYIVGIASISAHIAGITIKSVGISGEASAEASVGISTTIEVTGGAEIVQFPDQGLSPTEVSGIGSVYTAPPAKSFSISQYDFESLTVSRSIQDLLWSCTGTIVGDDVPEVYEMFTITVADHLGVEHDIFHGFIPGNDRIQSVASNRTEIQGYDAPFYLSRQYLPDGNTSYPAEFSWTPRNMILEWLGGEGGGWRQVTGIYPHKIFDPTDHGNAYTPKDYTFQPKTNKFGAIKEVCEYAKMIFLVKWVEIDGALTPCAYLVHEDDVDDSYWGLDLPDMAVFEYPSPYVKDEIQASEKTDEKYNRIIVRSSAPDGTQYVSTKETAALTAGEELPVEHLETRSDLPQDADHGTWCVTRAEALFDYYSATSYTYDVTLLDRTDLRLYQRVKFNGFYAIPSDTVMRIIAIEYVIYATHTEVSITVAPAQSLSDLERLERAIRSDSISEIQSIISDELDQMQMAEVGTVTAVSEFEATVSLERDPSVIIKGRIVSND